MSNLKKFFLTIGILIIALACLAGFNKYASAESTKEIKNVAIKFIELQQKSTVLPNGESLKDGKIDEKVKSEHKAAMHKELEDVISPSSGLLAKRIGQFDKVIDDPEVNHYRVEDGGVKDDITIKSLDITGDTAIFVADMTVWSKFTTYTPEKITSNPTNRAICTFTLKKENSKWKVSEFSFQFLPGQEP